MPSFRLLLLKASLPLTRAMNKMHISRSHRDVKAKHYRKALEVLQPGDVLLTWRWGEFSNLFIPGNWSHAALYVGNNIVREATYAGVHDTDLIDFMLSKDKVLILTPQLPEPIRTEAAKLSSYALGKSYDFFFESGDKAFYCSELVYWSYLKACQIQNQEFTFNKSNLLGEETFLPEDFVRPENHFFTQLQLP